jgi:hypothetical protein
MATERFQVFRRVKVMMWKRVLLLLCVVLTVPASYSFGDEDEVNVTVKYVAEHKDQFRVETSVCEGGVKFTFTQFADEPRYCLGNLKIRKAGRTLVDCQLLPTKAKLHVSFSFTVSREVVSESEFVLYEDGFGRAFGPDGKPLVPKVQVPQICCGGTNYYFRLKDFVNSARQPDRNGSSKPGSSAQ